MEMLINSAESCASHLSSRIKEPQSLPQLQRPFLLLIFYGNFSGIDNSVLLNTLEGKAALFANV